MPCQLMIFARDKDAERFKGTIIEVRDDLPLGSHWLPDMIVVHIEDATKAQAKHYHQQWIRVFEHEIITENVNGWRIKISVNPNIRVELGIDKAFRNEFRDYLVDSWGAVVFEYDTVNNEYAILDFPKPLMFNGVEVGLLELRADVKDKFEDAVAYRKYRFNASDVDAVISAGGYVTQTAAQVLAKIVDRAWQ